MKNLKNAMLLVSAVAMLSACGNSQGERALSGAGIGAGVGAVGGAIIGGDPVTGAAIGAGVGATAGALIKKEKLDLGKPLWK